MTPAFKAKAMDVALRGAKTFAQAFIAVEVAAGTGYLNVDTLEGAAVAGGAAVLSFLQNALSTAEAKPTEVVVVRTPQPMAQASSAPAVALPPEDPKPAS